MGKQYYSLNGKGKYFISEPDENGMVTAIDSATKKIITVKKSDLTLWKSSFGVTQLINRKI